jgi:hypothetical protein
MAFGSNQVRQSDSDIQRLSSNLRSLAARLDKCPLISGVLLPDVTFTQNQVRRVGHTLGRAYLGYLVVKQNATGNLVNSPSSESDNKVELGLVSSTTMTCSLWVF